MNIKTEPIGTTFTADMLRNQCSAVWGGMSYPGKLPGYCVVIGMDLKRCQNNYDMYLLDEFEAIDVRDLVEQAAALELKYAMSLHRCSQWVGDPMHDAGSRFVDALNERNERFEGHVRDRIAPEFILQSSQCLALDNMYAFILARLKQLLQPDRRRLFLKDGKVLHYLNDIDIETVGELKMGDYPAVEALGWLVVEMTDYMGQKPVLNRDIHQDAYRGWKYGQRNRKLIRR